MKIKITLYFFFIAQFLFVHHALAQTVYWTDFFKTNVWRTSADGLSVDNVTPTAFEGFITGLAIDQDNGHIYLSVERNYVEDIGEPAIKRMNLDGSGLIDIINTDVIEPQSIVIDHAQSKLYWVETGVNVTAIIKKSDLDGGNVETIFNRMGWSQPIRLTISDSGDQLFWVTSFDGDILRLDSDGNNVERIIRHPGGNYDYRDLVISKDQIFWVARHNSLSPEHLIMRSDLDGENIDTVVNLGVLRPTSIGVDSLNEKIFWGINEDGQYEGLNKMQRADWDGSNMENFFIAEELIDGYLNEDIRGIRMYYGLVSALNDLQLNKALSLFPNPSTGNINIRLEAPESATPATHFAVYNNIGQRVLEGRVDQYINGKSLQINSGAGIYHLLLLRAGVVISKSSFVINP